MNGIEALQTLRHRGLNCLILRKAWKSDKYIEVDCINGLFVTSEGFNDSEDELIKSLDKHYTSTDVFLNELFFDDWEIVE